MTELTEITVVNDHAVVNGGQARVAVDTATGLARRGYRVNFFAGMGPADPSLGEAGVNVVLLDQADLLTDTSRLRAAARGLWNGQAADKLRALLAKSDPRSAVVHCHGFAKSLSPAIGPVLTNSGVPLVFTMHESFLACPNGAFFDYQTKQQCFRKPLGFSCLSTNCDARALHHKAWRVARQALLRTAGGLPKNLRDIIYISESHLEVMRPYLPSGARLHHVPNPVDVAPAPPVDSSQNDIFLFVGRLSAEKGCVLFAEAAAAAGAKAVFVGEGPERDAIARANPGALITDWLSPEEVDSWIARARCLVFPSLWREPLGLVVLEAAARGVPTIAMRWGGPSETILDGVTGMLLDAADVGKLAAAIREMTPQRAASLGRAAYERYWSDPPTLAAHLDRLLAVYDCARNDRFPAEALKPDGLSGIL